MKRQNIEVVLGFLDAIRRRDGQAAAAFLDPDIVWQGVIPDLVCRHLGEVLGVFLGRRDEPIEVDRLELIGAQRGAVFAFHRPEVWEVAGVEIRGAIYHAPRDRRREDHEDRRLCRPGRGVRRDRARKRLTLREARPGGSPPEAGCPSAQRARDRLAFSSASRGLRARCAGPICPRCCSGTPPTATYVPGAASATHAMRHYARCEALAPQSCLGQITSMCRVPSWNPESAASAQAIV